MWRRCDRRFAETRPTVGSQDDEGAPEGPRRTLEMRGLEVHVSAAAAAWPEHCVLLGLVGDDRLGRQEQRADRLAAFCSAERVTLVGSITPNFSMSPYSPVAAFKPVARVERTDLLDDDAALEAGVRARSA